MSFFRANAQISGGSIEHVSFVSPSFVDMTETRILNTGNPVLDGDAVNKRTLVDYVTQRVTFIETNIQGNEVYVAVDGRLYGAYTVTVMGTTEGKALGIFHVSKTSRTKPAAVQIMTSAPGEGGSRLNVTWPSNSGIHVGKSGLGDDGIYVVKIV